MYLSQATKIVISHYWLYCTSFVPKLSLDLVLIIYFRNGVQGNETDSRPSSRAGSPSKFRKISGGSLSRYSTKDECLLLRLIALQLQLYLFWQMMWLWGSRGKCWSVVLSNYRSESMNNLDWSNAEDEKDKRIRELEDTLRKQKELMEILQVHMDDLHNSQLTSFWFPEKNAACRRWRSAQISLPGVGWNSRPLKVSIVWRAGKVSKLRAKSYHVIFLFLKFDEYDLLHS